ncbi:Alcohol dehydrogenase zinc-binding domain protein [Catenulispora acidiphila DSM 44928]|uniref:Alcohol dehydrogenase zinc-binding domain protein n=1 Tax=Catenulispora acidiphila (strain DSM 44928 / JCM 14897 / NBRC 102108 / NRRL B-24433 / ID139908) TaxID=479433 RepID=C7Q5Y7_CATAD|nr:NADP-dependent oxidoreductase [Catenulispora acidiphila]ACU70084.1 Alcohol dehydrogenase zinc-binding domain protein [Catenulispora acidiphila DSM 44928]
MSVASREWQLIARPVGEPKDSDFRLVSTEVADPGPGEVLVRNTWLSVDPYMRGRMDDVPSYIPPFQLNEAMTGGAVGVVVAAGDGAAVPVGTTVQHFEGWREYALLDGTKVQPLDVTLAPPQAYLGVLGVTGLTAYVGLTEIAPVKEGEVVFISGAAGAVGSVAGQIAKKLGAAKVIGSAGGPEKARRLKEDFGFDAAIDYREGQLRAQLKQAAPEGIDVYFDNVGGDHLDAALTRMNLFGRIALCGAISAYNEKERPSGPAHLSNAIGKSLTLRGFTIGHHMKTFPEYIGKAAGWLADGSLRADETVVDGIENGLNAWFGLMSGANTGKMLVRLPEA